jgi:hypothetical protein
MKPAQHLIISFSLSLAIWMFLKSLSAAAVCFITGIFMDIDHLLEYLIHFGWREFSLGNLCRECDTNTIKKGMFRFRKLYLIFHSVEFSVIFWLTAIYTKNIYIFALALSYFIHLVFDFIGNSSVVRPYFYFISWRLACNFRTTRMLNKQTLEKNKHLEAV